MREGRSKEVLELWTVRIRSGVSSVITFKDQGVRRKGVKVEKRKQERNHGTEEVRQSLLVDRLSVKCLPQSVSPKGSSPHSHTTFLSFSPGTL